jgi:AcrR family transcriptional regulator
MEAVGRSGATERTWGGTTLAERRAGRREALLVAALDLIGEQGGAGVTVRSVCRRAELTDRYFYENFAGRDELLAALFLTVATEVQHVLTEAIDNAGHDRATVARAAVEAMVSMLTDDPRKGRLILVEPLSDPALSEAGLALVPAFTRLVRAQLPKGESRARRAMAALGLAGAVGGLFASWLGGKLHVTRAELVDYCVELIIGTFESQDASGKLL